ncbi:MAG TPA: TetR family transcriptional regulator [Pseudonocardia sp.]|nr:TetR family transcriptional regulator [Pseudonocardia sp.]
MSDPVHGSAARRRLAPADRRDQLLDRALELVAESGAAAVTMQAVARAAGVARPVVYDFFADRAALLDALLAREETRALADVLSVAPEALTGTDLGDSVTRALDAFLTLVLRRPTTWRVLLAPSAALPTEVGTRIEQGREKIAGVIESSIVAVLGQRAAGLDTEVVALAVIAAGEAAARLVLAAPEQFPPARLTRFTRTLLGALPLPPGPAR